MINNMQPSISSDTKKIIVDHLSKLTVLPKVKDIKASLKVLVKAELEFNKQKFIFRDINKNRTIDNVTDKLVDCVFGIILKQLRRDRQQETINLKRTGAKRRVSTVLEYCKMSDNDSGMVRGKWTLRPNSELLRRDFTKLMVSVKGMTIEKALEETLNKYNQKNKEELENYINLYFK